MNRDKLRIIVDLDETVYNLHAEWCNAHNADFPDKPLCPEDIVSWQIEKYAANGEKIFDYLSREELFSNGKPIAGAIEMLTLWYESGFELGIATRTITPEATAGKSKWLGKYLPFISAVFFLLSDSKWWIDGDIFIDDAPHHLENVRGVRIMYNQPHNQAESRFPRANDWVQVNTMVYFAAAALRWGRTPREIEETLLYMREHNLV